MRLLPSSSPGRAHLRSAFALPKPKLTFVLKFRNYSYSGAALFGLFLVSSILWLSAPVFAQASAAASAARSTTTHGYRRPTLDERVKILSRNLDLTEAQQSAVKKIPEERQEETLRLRLTPSLSGGARIDAFRALQDKTIERIRGVLTDEQKQKYDPLAVRRIPADPQQRSVEDWLESTTTH